MIDPARVHPADAQANNCLAHTLAGPGLTPCRDLAHRVEALPGGGSLSASTPAPSRYLATDTDAWANDIGARPLAASREPSNGAPAITRSPARLDASRGVRFASFLPTIKERARMQYLLRFLRRGPISPRVHGTLDYLLAAALIAVPLAVDFHDDTATVLMLVLGGAATLLAIGTNWSTGIIRILPPALHGIADIAATIVLIIAPFVLGFTDDTAATVLYVVIGAGGLGATLLTRFESDLMPAARTARQQPAA
jgi:hypothetical protein